MFKNKKNLIKKSEKVIMGTAGVLSAAAIQMGLQNNEVHASSQSDASSSTVTSSSTGSEHGVSLADNEVASSSTTPIATNATTSEVSGSAASQIDKIVSDAKAKAAENSDSTANSKTSTNTDSSVSTAKIVTKDSTLIAGPNTTWKAEDNFVSATDASGNAIDFNKLTTSGTVDLKKLGAYKITYSFKDDKGSVINQVATVTLVASKASVTVSDKKIVQGSTWTPADGFYSGTDAAGNPLKFDDIKYSGTVDTNKVGTYKVTYSYVDSQGNIVPGVVSTVQVIAPTSNSDTNATNNDSNLINQNAATHKSSVNTGSLLNSSTGSNLKKLSNTASTSGTNNSSSSTQLPQTGTTDDKAEKAVGMLVLAGLISLFGSTIKNKKHN